MVRAEIFGGVDANMYIPTRCINSRHDDEYSVGALPDFALLLTPDQVDSKFTGRRQRKEDREKGFATPNKMLQMTRSSTKSVSSEVRPSFCFFSVRESKRSDDILRRAVSMKLSPGVEKGEQDQVVNEKDSNDTEWTEMNEESKVEKSKGTESHGGTSDSVRLTL